MQAKKQTWGIIGGGILGMTLAHRLSQQDQPVTLFEAADHLGGLASAWQLGDVTWDRHYHVTLLSDTYVRSLLRELGLEQQMEWVETKTGFYSDGKLYSMSNSLEFLTFPPLNLLNKIRLGLTILYASKVKNWTMLQTQLVEGWLRKWSGKNTFEKIWLPLLRSKLGETYLKTSAAFIWATIQRMYAARRSGMKKEMFGYVPGGYARILEEFYGLLTKEGVIIKVQHAAQKISSTHDDRIKVDFQNGKQEIFDHVIITIPSSIASKICSELTEDEKKKLNDIQYLGVICASLLLKKPLSKFYVTNITDTGFPFTGVIEMSALVDNKYFGRNSLVYLPKYVTPDDPYFALSDQEIQDQFLTALIRMHLVLSKDDLLGFRVSREQNVFALSTLNYSEKLPPIQTSIPGLFIINSAHIVNGTLNVNETVKLAESILPQILQKIKYEKAPRINDEYRSTEAVL